MDLVKDAGLKIYGKNFIKSIYKDERTPSLKIYADTNTYKCYATDVQGDVIKFYMDLYRVDFKEALRELGERAGMDISQSQKLKVKSKNWLTISQ